MMKREGNPVCPLGLALSQDPGGGEGHIRPKWQSRDTPWCSKSTKVGGDIILGITESFLEEDTLDLTGRLNSVTSEEQCQGRPWHGDLLPSCSY